MPYRVEFKPGVAHAFDKLPAATQRRIQPTIDALARQPRPLGVKKLAGEADTYRVRVGDYRIVYEIRDRVLLVLIIAIAHRRDVYR